VQRESSLPELHNYGDQMSATKIPAAIIFGSIGTIAETSEIQRKAFNAAFREAGLDWNWTVEVYKPMLRKSGGAERIQDYADSQNQTVDAKAVHEAKTRIFTRILDQGGLPLRKGVMDILMFAKLEGVKLGFATDTSAENIETIFRALSGLLKARDFDWIGGSSVVSARKPDPEIYNIALAELDVSADQAIAIEDTEICLKAPVAAGITTVGFPNEFADKDDFSDAAVVVKHLDPDLMRLPMPTALDEFENEVA
jgi:beta-phosphoglucomutase-like phosphatase (HAD superfamily)